VARVLVTGATGFVGGRVARALRARGDEVVATVRTPSDDLAALGVAQPVVALTDAEALATAMHEVEAVVHAAAGVGPDLDSARTVNTLGTRAVVDAALAAGVSRLVHVSTTSVYDLEAVGDAEVAEDTPLARAGTTPPAASSAGSAYAVTKAEAEAEVVRGGQQGLSIAILRPPAVLGAGPTSTWGTRVPQGFVAGELAPRPPETTFGWVHVDDLVDAALAAVDGDAGATVNVVGGHTTFGGYLRALREFLPDAPTEDAVTTDAPWRGTYATDRLPALFGVRPTRDFATAMAEIRASWT